MTCEEIQTLCKGADEVLDYILDWSDWLGTDTISTGTPPVWTVPSGITKDSQSETTTTATIILSGGTIDTTYRISCKITTDGGRVATRSFDILIGVK